MIADIYKQGFGSLSGLISKTLSCDSVPDNHNLIHFQSCNSVILHILAHKTSQNPIYRHLWLCCTWINHPARSKIVDAPLTLMFGMGQGPCLFHFLVGKRAIHRLWSFASNRHLAYSWWKTKNHWRTVNYWVQDGATSVAVIFFGITAANSSEKKNGMQTLIFCD